MCRTIILLLFPESQALAWHINNHGKDQAITHLGVTGDKGLYSGLDSCFVVLFAPPFSLSVLTLFGVSCLEYEAAIFSFKQIQ